MTIWAVTNPAFLASNLEHSRSAAAAQGVPVYELTMAAIAIAVWACVVVVITAYLQARERAAAQAHIRSMLVVRRHGAVSNHAKQPRTATRTGRRHSRVKPVVATGDAPFTR